MRLSEIYSQVKTITVPVGTGTLQVTYRPQAITPEMVDRMNDTRGATPGEAIATCVVDLVSSWDLTSDDGKPYPITLESVRQLPIAFLAEITKAVTADITPNAQRRNSSNGGSSMTGN